VTALCMQQPAEDAASSEQLPVVIRTSWAVVQSEGCPRKPRSLLRHDIEAVQPRNAQHPAGSSASPTLACRASLALDASSSAGDHCERPSSEIAGPGCIPGAAS
jgi:hypothetical protein